MGTATVLLIVGIVGIFAAIMLSLTAVGVFDNEARGVSKSLSMLESFSAAPPELRKTRSVVQRSSPDAAPRPFARDRQEAHARGPRRADPSAT